MDTLQLKLFISLAQNLSFTKTANDFFMTQPTVSNQIKALEKDLGVKLFNRDSRSVSLTTEGKEFLGYAEQILTLQIMAETRLRNISDGRCGYIHIAMLSSHSELFSRCLTEFSTRFSDVQTDVDMIEGEEMVRAITHNSHDLYFLNNYMLPDNDKIVSRITGTDRLHIFAHKSVADKIDMNDWSTINGMRFVSVPEMDFVLSSRIKKICMKNGIVQDTINYYNRAATLLLAVNSNIGLAVLPLSVASFNHFNDVVAIPIPDEEAVIQTAVAWHKDNTNADVEHFLSLNVLKNTFVKG